MSGAAVRRFDPANDTHYAISEQDEFQLRTIARACEVIGMAFEGADPDRSEVTEEGAAQVFLMLGYAIDGVLARRYVVFPQSGQRRKA